MARSDERPGHGTPGTKLQTRDIARIVVAVVGLVLLVAFVIDNSRTVRVGFVFFNSNRQPDLGPLDRRVPRRPGRPVGDHRQTAPKAGCGKELASRDNSGWERGGLRIPEPSHCRRQHRDRRRRNVPFLLALAEEATSSQGAPHHQSIQHSLAAQPINHN